MPRSADSPLAGRRLLIFDLDGTVADTSPIHAASFQAAFDRYGVRIDYPAIAGLRMDEAIDRLAAVHGLALDDQQRAELVAVKRRATDALLPGVQPLPGASTFLRQVRRKYQLAMVTSGARARVADTLAHLGLQGWFNPLIVGDDLHRAKPDPEGYARTLALTGIPAAEALVFEDAEAGVAAAQAAGIDVVVIGDAPIAGHAARQWPELLAAAA